MPRVSELYTELGDSTLLYAIDTTGKVYFTHIRGDRGWCPSYHNAQWVRGNASLFEIEVNNPNIKVKRV